MKKTVLSILMGLLAIALTSVSAQDMPHVFSPERVIVGQPLQIIYNPALTALNGSYKVDAVVYYWQNYHWVANDVALTKDGALWKATVVPPNDAALVTVKYVSEKGEDTGGRLTYSTFTMDAKGEKNLPSAYIGWGMFRNKNMQQYSIPKYVADSAMIGDDVMIYWINQELMHSPQSFPKIYDYAQEVMKEAKPAKADSVAIANIDMVMKMPNLTEDDYVRAAKVAQRASNYDLAKKITDEAIKKYPDGIFARDVEISRVNLKISDLEVKTAEFAKFVERFPYKKFETVHTDITDLWYAKLVQGVIYNAVIKHNDYSLLHKYISITPYQNLATYLWHMVQIPYRDKMMTADVIYPHAKLIVDEIFNRPRNAEQLVYSPKEWNEMLYKNNKDGLHCYATILYDSNRKDEAIALMTRLAPIFDNKDASFANDYINMLDNTERKGEIIPMIESCVYNDAATPEMLARLKADYIKRNGSDAGYEKYEKGLKSDEAIKTVEDRLKSELINEPIKLFALEDIDGNKVDMSKMKGKIIILDFWATWCSPCKAAMPGMQMAVDKYKDDKNVNFFFVCTSESIKKELLINKIRSFIKEKSFNFTVLLDGKVEGAKSNELVYGTYCKDYNFSGIPQKMIIDANGRLRWRSCGYYGSPSALADEISFIVEYLKNEK